MSKLTILLKALGIAFAVLSVSTLPACAGPGRPGQSGGSFE